MRILEMTSHNRSDGYVINFLVTKHANLTFTFRDRSMIRKRFSHMSRISFGFFRQLKSRMTKSRQELIAFCTHKYEIKNQFKRMLIIPESVNYEANIGNVSYLEFNDKYQQFKNRF